MRYLGGLEARAAQSFLDRAASMAQRSDCLLSRCGSVIVASNEVIGAGCNGFPGDLVIWPTECYKDSLPKGFKSDPTCCVHAEQRAIVDALRNYPDEVQGSRIYFIRLDANGNQEPAGDPYCTICSKFSLDVGIAEFVLKHPEGIAVYETPEYNEISFGRLPSGRALRASLS